MMKDIYFFVIEGVNIFEEEKNKCETFSSVENLFQK